MRKPIIPNSRPKVSEEQVRALLAGQGVTSPVAIVGVRGYYSQTFGKPGNDRDVYDDALLVVGPRVFASFNGNTDPSVFKTGIATLKIGLHWYKKGMHNLSKPWKMYRALRPATPGEQVPVTRDNTKNPRPGVAINIHRGGNDGTYSEGCQTIPPAQYDAFLQLVYGEMDRAKITRVPYLLVDKEALQSLLKTAVPARSTDVLEKILRDQMTRDHALTKLLREGAAKAGLSPAWVLAIASRETGIVNTVGDGGHGRGVMQIDDRSHPIATATDFTKAPGVLIDYGCNLLASNLRWAQKNWPQYSDAQRLKIASAAYNAGQGGARKGVVAGDADAYTAHHDYGADVLKRLAIFEKLLGEIKE